MVTNVLVGVSNTCKRQHSPDLRLCTCINVIWLHLQENIQYGLLPRLRLCCDKSPTLHSLTFKFCPSFVLFPAFAGGTPPEMYVHVTTDVTWYTVLKGIVHFEIKIWYVSAYPKGIQDVGVFFSSVDPILMFLGQTVLVCQSYNGRYRSLSLWERKRTCTEKFKLNNSPS